METRAKGAWHTPLLCGLCFAVTLCLYAPIETYLSARGELWFSLVDFIWPCLAAFLAVWLISFGLTELVRGRLRALFCALAVAFAAMLLTQGAFLNADYGVLNGSTIDWDSYGNYSFWNLLIWLVVLGGAAALALCFGKKLFGMLRFAAVALMLIALAGLGAQAAFAPGKERAHTAGFSTQGEFTLASQNNAVVFILDTLDATSFSEYMLHHPEWNQKLDGFTWFPNMVGQYPVTAFALPVILTGERYLYETSRGQYYREAWDDETFFRSMKADGFDIRLYTESEFALDASMDRIDNILLTPLVPSSVPKLWKKVMRLSGFRYAPHAHKNIFWMDTNDFEGLKASPVADLYKFDDEYFLAAFRSTELHVMDTENAFRLYHLQGAHTAYTLTAEGKRDLSGVTLHEQITGVMNGIDEYLSQMKALGLYDNATIVITADHGNMAYDPAPFLLIKRPGDEGALQTNAGLVDQNDLHLTIAVAAGLTTTPDYGRDAFSLAPDEWREMNYYSFHWAEGDRLHEYCVTRDDRGKLLYEATDSCYMSGGVQDESVRDYTLGERLTFAHPNDASVWCDELAGNYLNQAENGVWFGDPSVRLRFRIADEVSGDLRVTFYIDDVIGEAQRLSAVWGGLTHDVAVVHPNDETASFVLPYDAIVDGELAVTLRFPDAISAYRLSGWVDPMMYRRAIAVTGLLVEAAD